MSSHPLSPTRALIAVAIACAMSALPLPGACASPLQTIYDSGEGVPLMHLLSQALPAPGSPEQARSSGGSAATLVQFPVRTPGLRAGRLRTSATWPRARWLTQPIFLVGGDRQSAQWLRSNRDTLASMGAAGIVVDCNTPDAFTALQVAGRDLALAPAASPWLAARLKAIDAAVLPLLILPDGSVTQALPLLPGHGLAASSKGAKP